MKPQAKTFKPQITPISQITQNALMQIRVIGVICRSFLASDSYSCRFVKIRGF